jgi:hypothetical protein
MIKEEFLFASGLDFNHLYVLQNINNLPEVNRLTGYYNILKAKGYIDGEVLSDKGQEIVTMFNIINKNEENVDNNKQNSEEVQKPLSFSQWVAELHRKLQDKLLNLTGSNSPNLVFDGKVQKWPYLCGVLDLEGKLKKFIGKYTMTDLERIEKLLLKHCEIRNQKIMRYIIKEGNEKGSDMALDYENYVEEKPKVILTKKDFF